MDQPVSSDENRFPALSRFTDHVPHESSRVRVHASRWFVQTNKLCVSHQRDRHAQFTLVSSAVT